jgi:hypothetical protein
MAHAPYGSDVISRPQTYRPVSLLAVGGVALSGLYAVLVAVTTVLAFAQAKPLLLPPWFQALAVAGVVLSLFARWRIAGSEGTLSGLALTRWGLWLAVPGLCYAAYEFATGQAVRAQANAFLMEKGEDSGFFPNLQEGDLNRAYLLTQPYAARAIANPESDLDMEMVHDKYVDTKSPWGYLSIFKNSLAVHAIRQSGGKGSVEPLGVRSWNFENERYVVVRGYKVTTPELTMEISIKAVAERDRATGVRKWFVKWELDENKQLEAEPEWTELGKTMQNLRESARKYLLDWVKDTAEGRKTAGPLPTDDTQWGSLEKRIRAAQAEEKTPGVVLAGGRNALKSFLQGTAKSHKGIEIAKQSLSPWTELPDKRLQLTLTFSIPVLVKETELYPKYVGEGKLLVETTGPVALPELPEVEPAWQVVSVRLERIVPMPKSKKEMLEEMQKGKEPKAP